MGRGQELMAVLAGLLLLLPYHADGGPAMGDTWRNQPQLTTSSRLLRLGEGIEFRFHAPPGTDAGDLVVYPRFLEQANPRQAFRAGEDLSWVEPLPHETLPVKLRRGEATISYTPSRPGSYLARWRAGEETFYRYFAAIEDDWVVLRFSTFEQLDPDPPPHAMGFAVDYRLPADRFGPEDPLFRKFLGFHRRFGCSVIPLLPDTPDLTHEARVAQYRAALQRVVDPMPDASNARSARLEMKHDLDPGYTRALAEVGVNDHCGLMEANARPWLGMPEFPYFSSPVDCRKANQGPGGDVVAHQWDFCGGWHFIGPVSWHFKAAAGAWEPAERCLREGLAELANAAQLSGHPMFAVPLYDGVTPPGYPNPVFRYGIPEHRAFRGGLRQVFLADRALTEAEVQAAMARGPGAPSGTPVVWALDEDAGELVGPARWTRDAGGPTLELGPEPGCVRLPDVPLPTGTSFTVGGWINPGPTQDTWANLISSHNDDGGRICRGFSLEQAADQTNRFYLIGGRGDHWAGTEVSTQLRAGEWQHFVVVREGARLRHYLNGRLTAEGDIGPEPFLPATDGLRLGDWARGDRDADDAGMRAFVERYQRLIAFDFPKRHRVAFARSVDIADYYRRHFRATPRTVFVSRTDHVLHDMWWLCHWCNEYLLVPRERLPWLTSMSGLMAQRRSGVTRFKDPLSYEYVLVEDQRASIRFERECPNPIWWFDYTRQQTGPGGSASEPTDIPDVTVLVEPWQREGRTLRTRVRVETAAEFPDYAICLWGLPAEVDPSGPVETDAREAILARNLQGESHLVLRFDLKPGAEVEVKLRRR